MDIVYILGTGSVWEDNEIRFSLRSVVKNVLDLENVFVIGERPKWLRTAIWIPCSDPYSQKWKNGYHKISRACREPAISDEFLLMNDDFFFFKPIKAKEYPFYYNDPLCRSNPHCSRKFLTTKSKTAAELRRHHKGTLDFSLHRPLRYQKRLFLDMPQPSFEWLGFSPRSFYVNYYNFRGTKCREPLISPLQKEKDFERFASEYTDFSIFTATARSSVFRSWIKKRFPKPSRFEAQ
jgi:hypothetical protein